MDSGDAANTDEPYQAATRRAFAGKVLAKVRPTEAGKIQVTASSPGLRSGSVSVTAQPAGQAR